MLSIIIVLSACLAISFSITFSGWFNRDIGLHDLYSLYVSFPGFGIHIIFYFVHWDGVHCNRNILLYMNSSSSSLLLGNSFRTKGFSSSGPAAFLFLKDCITSPSLSMSKPSITVLFIRAILIFMSLCSISRGGPIDGKCECIRYSRVSYPGFVDEPSGLSRTPKVLLLFFYSIFLNVLIDSLEFCFVLKSLQSCFFAFRQLFLYVWILALSSLCLSSVLQAATSFFSLFISFRWFCSLVVHRALFKSLGLFFLLGQCLSIAFFIWEYHWSRHFSSLLLVMLAMILMFLVVKECLKSTQSILFHFLVGGMSTWSIINSYLIVLWSEKLGLVLTLQFLTVTEILAVNVTPMIKVPIAAWKVGVLPLFSTLRLYCAIKYSSCSPLLFVYRPNSSLWLSTWFWWDLFDSSTK